MASLRIDVCTLFPELVRPYLETGIVGRAAEKGLVELAAHNIRDQAPPPHHHVDDTPYGGGGGMVMKPDIVAAGVRATPGYSKDSRVLVTAARGRPWTDARARELADAGGHVVIVCGRYEGIDQRAIEALGAEEVSVGDFVVSGGEAAAVMILDSIVRLIPGATGNESARTSDSFGGGILEHPHYTRPAEFEGRGIPDVLGSGDHARIERWRRKSSLEHTWRVRPELLEAALDAGRLPEDDLELLAELGHPRGRRRPRKRRRRKMPEGGEEGA